ncbi:dihydrolipoamide acetyltransferase family protein [Marinitoga litoralis]|uniref:dihydrolipoamide acetyltransferase family protein n=1 Tax=Marinitoga litoralis TaxID=570855 RepID=UPI0019617041|nr:dihydrolipoamide acetyltransferase family protein [Marinitoga litoralis]MBM7559226.1 pyruvate dehydrogenase E2 component (dihydrolipoamide acetyltransferase) [Marinitoga litoralis]
MAEKLYMIALSPTMEKGTIVKWNIKENESFTEGDVLCEVETDKTTMDYEATDEGTILKILVPEGGKAAVGEPIAIFGEPGEDISDLLFEEKEETEFVEEKTQTEKQVETKNINISKDTSENNDLDRIKISPLARKIALMKNIDISKIKGTGPGGRIVKRDVENEPVQTTKEIKRDYVPIQVETRDEDIVIPLSDKRRIIGERLSQSKYTAPHFYLTVSVDMSNVLENRKLLNKKYNLSLNAFIIKIVANTLKKHRRINATLNNDSIIEFGRVDIALAVAQEDGLITPIVRNADKKGILQIDDELKTLIDKAKNNKLDPEEYTNATFTISNLGSFGIDEFTAIINPPGSAILAVGMIKETPVVENGEIVIKPIMKMTLSSDHRVIDGALAAAFMKDLKDTFENPILAIL